MADFNPINPMQTDPGFGLPGQQINPQYATPEQLYQLRALANTQITQHEPAKSWAGVLGGMAQTLAGYKNLGRAQDMQNATIGSKQQAWQQGYQGLDNAYGGQGAGGGLLGSSPSPSGGGMDPKAVASYYTSQGLSPTAAAGLTAGFQAESGLNPGVSKVGDGRDGSPSSGIGQWNAQRAQRLAAYARMVGKSPSDPQVQLDFPLVELGMKGDPSTPGYGTELKSRQALLGAQTPQQATAAALMYERPAGYTDKNPMGANSAQKRLAMTTALMGGDASGGGAQPIQMAQNTQRGFGGAPAANILGNPFTTPEERQAVLGMTTPQQVGIPGGGAAYTRPSQGPQASTSVEGAYPSSVSTPDATVPVVPRIGPKGPATGAIDIGGNGNPSGNAGGLTQNQSLNQIISWGQQNAANRAELGQATDLLKGYKEDGINAKNQIGMIDSFRELGRTIESGWSTRALSVLANAGVPLTGNDATARMQAYQELAHKLGVPGEINVMNLDPGARDALANSIESQLQYRINRMNLAQRGGNQIKTLQDIGKMEPPRWAVGSPGNDTQGGTSAGGGAGTNTGANTGQGRAAMSQADMDASKANAAAAIKAGKPRDAVIAKLRAHGIDPSGL